MSYASASVSQPRPYIFGQRARGDVVFVDTDGVLSEQMYVDETGMEEVELK